MLQSDEGAPMTTVVATAAIAAEDIVYHRPDGAELLARIYRPSGPAKAAVVSVHGGRWVAETRLTNEIIDKALAASGVLTMALDFRMPPKVRYPVPVADINLAIRWLKLNGRRFGFNGDKVGAVGTSSGGHQVLLNALRPEDPRYAAERLEGENIDATLAYVVVGWPVSDPWARYQWAQKRKMDIHVEAHHAYWPDEASMKEGNPRLILERRETTRLPPLLILQGADDVVLTPDMNDRFAEAWRAAGGQVELEKYAGQPHTFITKNAGTPPSDAALKKLTEFVLRQSS
jgi:acetyl esterase